MLKIGIDSSDIYLIRRIALELEGDACVHAVKSERETAELDLLIKDLNTGHVLDAKCKVLTLSSDGSADLTLPLPLGAIRALILSEKGRQMLSINPLMHTASLGGRTVKLTDIEYTLLSLLYKGGGNFVSRDEIRTNVWGGNAENGLINIYIHYLREKLETDGIRLIVSSRKNGYAIDPRFLGGDKNADSD